MDPVNRLVVTYMETFKIILKDNRPAAAPTRNRAIKRYHLLGSVSAETQAYNTKPRDNTNVDAIDKILIEPNLVPRKPSSGLKKSWANGWAEINKPRNCVPASGSIYDSQKLLIVENSGFLNEIILDRDKVWHL